MGSLEIILIVLNVAFLLVAVLSIPFFVQIWRTAKSMALTLQLLNQNLPGILRNLEEITTNVNRTTTIVTREVEEFSLTIRKIQGTLGLLVGIEEIVRRNLHLTFAHKVRTSMAVAKGVRVFLDYLLSKRPATIDCK
jgi:uncharacterized protein YoxC